MYVGMNSRVHTCTHTYRVAGIPIATFLVILLTSLFALAGLPNDLKVYWQQYPWGLGVALCKIRALVSEM